MAVLNTTQQSGVLVGYIFSFVPGHSFPKDKRVINRHSCCKMQDLSVERWAADFIWRPPGSSTWSRDSRTGSPKSSIGSANSNPLSHLHRLRAIILNVNTIDDDPELHFRVIARSCNDLKPGAMSDLLFAQENLLVLCYPEFVHRPHLLVAAPRSAVLYWAREAKI